MIREIIFDEGGVEAGSGDEGGEEAGWVSDGGRVAGV